MFGKGDVFLDGNFPYLDSPGTTGKKILILLNTPSKNDNLVFVKTTSQPNNKPDEPGCIDNWMKLYYLPVKEDILLKNTWIQLDDHFLFLQSHADDKLKKIGSLKSKTTNKIIDCFLQLNEEDLAPITKNLIVSSTVQAANALAAKFNKRR